MQVAIKPTGAFEASVSVPGSKSLTNRALALAALTEGRSVLRHPLDSEDTEVMREALREFGVEIDDSSPDCFVIEGRGGKFKSASGDIDLANAGTAMRFLTSLAAIVPGRTILTGNDRMQERPIAPLIDGLRQLGVRVITLKGNGCPPVAIESDQLIGGKAEIPGDISSQYFSSLMMVAPFAQNDVELQVLGAQSSKPYIDLTLDVIAAFGGNVEHHDYQSYKITAAHAYKATDYLIEADASSASYFMMIAALTGSRITVRNLNSNSRQGDIAFCDALERMGCIVEKTLDTITVTGPKILKAITLDMNAMPDMVQSLAPIAACAEGETTITNVANLALKETDRLAAIVAELKKLGIHAKNLGDGVVIRGGKPKGREIKTYGDHRMAMAFAALGTRIQGVVIDDHAVVNKSFPTFWTVLSELGVGLEYAK